MNTEPQIHVLDEDGRGSTTMHGKHHSDVLMYTVKYYR